MRWLETISQVHKKHTAMLGASASGIEDLAEKIEEAIPLHRALKGLFEELTGDLKNDPPPEVRRDLWLKAQVTLQQWTLKKFVSGEVESSLARSTTASSTGSLLSFIPVSSRPTIEPKGHYASMSF